MEGEKTGVGFFEEAADEEGGNDGGEGGGVEAEVAVAGGRGATPMAEGFGLPGDLVGVEGLWARGGEGGVDSAQGRDKKRGAAEVKGHLRGFKTSFFHSVCFTG